MHFNNKITKFTHRNVIIKSFWNINKTVLLAKHLSRVPNLEPVTKEETVFDEVLQEGAEVN